MEMSSFLRRLRHTSSAIGAAASGEPLVPHAIVDYDGVALAQTTAYLTAPDTELTPQQISHFMIEGYVVLPGILQPEHCTLLQADVDQVELDRGRSRESGQPGTPNNVGYEHIGKLTSHPPIINKLQQVTSLKICGALLLVMTAAGYNCWPLAGAAAAVRGVGQWPHRHRHAPCQRLEARRGDRPGFVVTLSDSLFLFDSL
eukprot:SAG11_NODE_1951_length_4011_cov_5.799080_4_plen_201_part_00